MPRVHRLMAVAFITTDYSGKWPYMVPGGCAYYRCLLPMSVAGVKGRMGLPAWDPKQGFGVKETESTGIFGFKTVVLKLLMNRWTTKQIELAQSLGQSIIVDIDDYHEALTPANAAYDATDPEKNKVANRDIYKQVIEAADIVTVSTPFLYDIYSQQRDNVYMIRNGVSLRQFERRKHRSQKPVFGWAGATNYRNNDLEQLREWLPDFLKTHNLQFHHAGHSEDAPSFAEVAGIEPWRVTTSPLTHINNYASGFKFDVGIVPLNDIPFNHAKSNIKGLEYMAAGIPFIASDLPEYRVLHETGVGVLATTADDWRAAATMYLDYKTRKQTSAAAWVTVMRDWSIEARAKEWAKVLS
jgi:glycosyltransferase involved in cell wall biosynthesis